MNNLFSQKRVPEKGEILEKSIETHQDFSTNYIYDEDSLKNTLKNLSDPQYYQMFLGPADFQYSLLRESFLSSKENTEKSFEILKNLLQDNHVELLGKIKLIESLRTVFSSLFSQDKLIVQQSVKSIFYSQINEIANSSITPYSLTPLLREDYFFKSVLSFEKMERDLTPIPLTDDIYIQDNGADPIPIFIKTTNKELFENILFQQKQHFQNARPENTPDLPKNANLKEMVEYKKKFLDSKIFQEEKQESLSVSKDKISRQLSINELLYLFPESKNTFDLTQDKLLEQFRSFTVPEIRLQIENDFNVNLKNIPLKQQIFFLTILNKETNGTILPIQEFTQKFKENGIKTFLSLGHDGDDMEQKILEIGSQLPQETAEKIFKKYSDIIDSVDSVLDVAQNNFKRKISLTPEMLQSVDQSLYKKSAQLLSDFYEKKDIDPEQLEKDLDQVNADTITTLSVFKYAMKFGEQLPLEDIHGAEFLERSGDQLSQEEISEMVDLYQKNWEHFEPQEIIQAVIRKFQESLAGETSNKQKMYLFKKDSSIHAFVKFGELSPGVQYASALNVAPSVHGYGLGEAMMDEALYREAQNNILHAVCESNSDSAMRYFEKGFIATGFSPDNPPFLQICWNEYENKNIFSKQCTKEELVMYYLKSESPHDITMRHSKDLSLLHNNFPNEKSLTRCFQDPFDKNAWYAVYEKIPDTYHQLKNT